MGPSEWIAAGALAVSTATVALAGMKQKRSAVRAEVTALESTVERLERELSDTRQRCASLESKIASVEAHCERLLAENLMLMRKLTGSREGGWGRR